jgi:hypothetical protein
MDKDAFYFPHFSNARNDRKLRRVRKELGMEGYGIYFAVLEVLRDQKDFKYPLEDIDLLSDELNTSEPKVKAVICNYGLFQTNDDDFFSIKFNEYLTPYLDAKERKRIAALKGNLIRYKHITKEQASEMTDSQIIDLTEDVRKARNARALPLPIDSTASQRKEKEIKTKEIKTNKKKSNNNNASANNDFEFEGWKKDFSIYKKYVEFGFSEAMNNDEFLKELNTSFESLDVKKTVRLSYNEYWSVESGWMKRKGGRAKKINFKETIRNILRSNIKPVYKGKPQYTQQNMFKNEPARPEERILNYDR